MEQLDSRLLSRLPKWAQYHIHQLEQEVEHWKQSADEYRWEADDYRESLDREHLDS